ncbi:hypothetical protein EVAR_86245_1 [Eumeta japonica]|uniref:Uncharacterized protein n=1 Tax=Eumeta variegata TaxID=151549 RepID=A0A4C1UBY3_EUMVA|nr:hypothetical protein EVAR_86245_1 [Eumeta japonica]
MRRVTFGSWVLIMEARAAAQRERALDDLQVLAIRLRLQLLKLLWFSDRDAVIVFYTFLFTTIFQRLRIEPRHSAKQGYHLAFERRRAGIFRWKNHARRPSRAGAKWAESVTGVILKIITLIVTVARCSEMKNCARARPGRRDADLRLC